MLLMFSNDSKVSLVFRLVKFCCCLFLLLFFRRLCVRARRHSRVARQSAANESDDQLAGGHHRPRPSRRTPATNSRLFEGKESLINHFIYGMCARKK